MAWNESGGNKNPWDRRPQAGATDLDEMVRAWQRKLAALFGGQGARGPGAPGARLNWGAILLLLVTIWTATGLYVVGAAERGVILRFGKHVETALPGWHWRWPWPIGTKIIVNVARNESIDDKTRMLTSDENLVDISMAVQYLRAQPEHFLFKVRDPEGTLRDVSESAIREIVGQSRLDSVLGAGRQEITEKTKALIQRTLDGYETGIQIITVNLTAVNVPEQVAPSQKDAIKAREDRDRLAQQAQAYANDILPKARGTAARRLQDAQAYRTQIVAEAEGETARFGQLLTAYERAPNVTRERLYLEAIESVLGRSRKVLIDTKGDNMLYVPLDKLLERNGGSASSPDPLTQFAPGLNRPEVTTEAVPNDPRARGDR
jgi:modulator of FtsH protease HflK